MRITPDWASPTPGFQTFAYFEGSTWKSQTIYESNTYFEFTISDDDFKFILPAGNVANFQFEIVN